MFPSKSERAAKCFLNSSNISLILKETCINHFHLDAGNCPREVLEHQTEAGCKELLCACVLKAWWAACNTYRVSTTISPAKHLEGSSSFQPCLSEQQRTSRNKMRCKAPRIAFCFSAQAFKTMQPLSSWSALPLSTSFLTQPQQLRSPAKNH